MSVARCQTKERICAGCARLIHDPAEFERALPGILILSSGQGDSRGDQGLCQVHQRLVTAGMTCGQYQPGAKRE